MGNCIVRGLSFRLLGEEMKLLSLFLASSSLALEGDDGSDKGIYSNYGSYGSYSSYGSYGGGYAAGKFINEEHDNGTNGRKGNGLWCYECHGRADLSGPESVTNNAWLDCVTNAAVKTAPSRSWQNAKIPKRACTYGAVTSATCPPSTSLPTKVRVPCPSFSMMSVASMASSTRISASTCTTAPSGRTHAVTAAPPNSPPRIRATAAPATRPSAPVSPMAPLVTTVAEPLIAQAGLAAMLLTISDTRSLKSQSLWVCQWPLTVLIQVRDATRSQKTNSWTGKTPAAGYWWNRPIDYHQKIATSTTTVNLSSATMVDLAHDKCHPSQNVRIPTH